MTEPQAQEAPAAEVPAAALSPPSPGMLLRAAREKAGLSAEDLSGQLKLAKGTLEALERDDFAALSEPVYVRGYYRKIAKLLPVSEKELIAGYNARSKPPRAVAPVAPSRIPLAGGVAAGASRHSFGPGLGILALAAIAIAIVLFLVMDREPPRRLAAADVTPPPAAAPAENPVPASVTDAPAETTAPVAAPATTHPVPAAAPSPAPGTSSATAPAPAAAPAAAPAKAEPVPAVANQLVLTFSESSFVRVEDNRGKTLAIGLVRSGERQTLDGQPPYTVFLGNAKNVKVYFNGQPVDFSAHVNAQNDTARFMVP